MPLDQIDVDEYEDQMTFLEHLEALLQVVLLVKLL